MAVNSIAVRHKSKEIMFPKARSARISTILTVVLFLGCASAPSLTDTGSRVRLIQKDQAAQCRFLRVVQYSDRVLGMGKSPTVMKAIGETSLRNAVAAVGGNAFVLLKDDSDWFLGNVAYQGEAFVCPE